MPDAFDDLTAWLKKHVTPRKVVKSQNTTVAVRESPDEKRRRLLNTRLHDPMMDALRFEHWFTTGGREIFPLDHWREQIDRMILRAIEKKEASTRGTPTKDG